MKVLAEWAVQPAIISKFNTQAQGPAGPTPSPFGALVMIQQELSVPAQRFSTRPPHLSHRGKGSEQWMCPTRTWPCTQFLM